MSLDGYSPCPGGRGKKIRFCCPDLVKELGQLDSMIENNQLEAASSLVETLQKTHPDCACLLGSLCAIRRSQGKMEEYLDVATRFFEKEPDNITARTQYICAKADNGMVRDVFDLLIDTIEKEEAGKLSGMTFGALFTVTIAFMAEGDFFLAIPLIKLLRSMQPDSVELNQMFFRCVTNRECPILLKDVHFKMAVPADFPETEKFKEAMQLAATGHWKQSRALFQELLPLADQYAGILYNLALLSFWLLDDETGFELLDRYAKDTTVEPEDAMEAILLKNYLSGTPWQDEVTDLALVRTVTNFDECLEHLLSNPRCIPIPTDQFRNRPDGSPPPLKAFMILSRNPLAGGEEVTWENVPMMSWTMFLYGKQTDREARAEIYDVREGEEDAVNEFLADVCKGLIASEGESTPIRSESWTRNAIVPRMYLGKQNSLTNDQMATLENDWVLKSFCPNWLNHKLGTLNNRTPLEALAAGDAQLELCAAVTGLEDLYGVAKPIARACDELRRQLNLPVPGPITLDAKAIAEKGISAVLGSIPMLRWKRISLDGLDSKSLSVILETALLFSLTDTILHAATILVDRPSDDMRVEIRTSVFDTLVRACAEAGDLAKAEELIAKACAEAELRNLSDGHWNLLDLQMKLITGNMQEAQALMQHVMTAHQSEQGVMAELTQLMMDLGLLNPDGTPRAVPGAAAAAPVAPPAAEKPSAGLWTPDAPQADNAAPSKLWTPGS
ncbi:MAG: hypothetical protein Q4G68_03795 [Planctomycetia bacterium]|nr:hypothetical protein [Planctomycetia bacterium]